MKTIIKAMVLTVVFAAPVFAADANQSAEGSGSCMMTSEQTAAMQQYLQAMQELMANIKKEKDPDKREAMVQQHLDNVRSGMQIMTMQGQDAAHCKTLSSLPLEDRMGLMEARMRMMSLIAMQMLEQDAEQVKQQKRYQKR